MTFAGAALTTNPVITVVFNGTQAFSVSDPSGFTQLFASGWASPNAGWATDVINSGFTGSTVTWGSTSPTAFCTIAVELDASAPVAEVYPLLVSRMVGMG